MSSKSQFRPTEPPVFMRVLSFLLLGFIFYGTTFEAAHKHGRLSQPSDISRGSAVQYPQSATDAANLASAGDCLICQLHQNFSTAVAPSREVSPGPTLVREIFLTTFKSFQTQSTATRSGRAPPSLQETA